jgi:hypothetical protein
VRRKVIGKPKVRYQLGHLRLNRKILLERILSGEREREGGLDSCGSG